MARHESVEDGLHTLRISIFFGSIGQLAMGSISATLVLIFRSYTLSHMRGDPHYKNAIILGTLGADACMIVAGTIGLVASSSREAVKAARPRIRRSARMKALAEGTFVVYSVAMALLTMAWLHTLPGVGTFGWLWKSLLTFPSVIFQVLWARTCLLFFQVEAAHRGRLAVFPSSTLLASADVEEPLLPSLRRANEGMAEADTLQDDGLTHDETLLSRYIGSLPPLLSAAIRGSGDILSTQLADGAQDTKPHAEEEAGVPVDSSDAQHADHVVVSTPLPVGPFVSSDPPPTAPDQPACTAAPPTPPAWPSIVRMMSSKANSIGAPPRGDAPLADSTFDGALTSDDDEPSQPDAFSKQGSVNTSVAAHAVQRPTSAGGVSLTRALGRFWPAEQRPHG